MSFATLFGTVWFQISFIGVALLLSLFYGAKAMDIHLIERHAAAPWAWKVHQFWLNFLGAAAGWVALWFVLRNISLAVDAPTPVAPTWSGAALFFLAFIGITGHLPFATVTGIQAFRELIAKVPGLDT